MPAELKKLIAALTVIDETLEEHAERLDEHDEQIESLEVRVKWLDGKVEKRGRPAKK